MGEKQLEISAPVVLSWVVLTDNTAEPINTAINVPYCVTYSLPDFVHCNVR